MSLWLHRRLREKERESESWENHQKATWEREIEISELWENPAMASKLVVIIVFILDLIAVGLAIAAEQRRSVVSSYSLLFSSAS